MTELARGRWIHTVFGRDRGAAAVCLIALCLLLGSGRMNSVDGGGQLAQAVHFCATGHLGADHRVSQDFAPKDFRESTGTWYDANDVGGTLLMLPAACVSVVLGANDPSRLGELTTAAKAGASLTFSFVGGLAVVFVFLSLVELLGDSTRAWWWSLVFLFGTGFLAYVKATWDVLPAAASVAALGWVVCSFLSQRHTATQTVYRAAAAVALASLCRYSLLPFLTIAVIAILLPALGSIPRRHLAGALLVLLVLLLPELAFNALRTGSFWRPAQTAPQLAKSVGAPHITWSYALGTTNLFFSFTRGLLFFAPVCLLAYFGAAFRIVRASGERRLAWLVALGASVGYVVAVCALHRWKSFGWGPRYLMPIVPVLFLVGVLTVERSLRPRLVGYAIAALGLLTQLPLVLANWHAVVAVVGKDPGVPSPIIGLWHSAADGIASGSGIGVAGDPEALQVPDVWWWHAVGNHAPHLVGLLIMIAGFATFVWLASSRSVKTSQAV